VKWRKQGCGARRREGRNDELSAGVRKGRLPEFSQQQQDVASALRPVDGRIKVDKVM